MDINSRIQRICHMELCFDRLQNAFAENPTSFLEDPELNAIYQELIQYYHSKEWLADYECDERGELPQTLKRGVLSQDAVYNFITEVNSMLKGGN